MSWAFIKDCVSFTAKVVKLICKPILAWSKDILRRTITVLGPSKSGKTTLIKLLRGEEYYIGEYNPTSDIVLIKKKKVIQYKLSDEDDPLKLKIKKDLPGQRIQLWEKVLRKDKPEGIILLVDLVGLVKNGQLEVTSHEEFTDFKAVDSNNKEIIVRTTPHSKFMQQVDSFKAIQDICTRNGITLKGMIVLLNKCEVWHRGVELVDIIHSYKTQIGAHVNLTIMAKSLGLRRDIAWEATSLDPDHSKLLLEPALTRFSEFLG